MPKLESPIAACLTLMVLASLAFALSFREGAAAPATDQQQPTLVVAATATATPLPTATMTPAPTATTPPIASPTAIPTVVPTATVPAPSPTPMLAPSPAPEPSPSPIATPLPAPPTAVVVVGGLNLRGGPGLDFPVIAVLGQGDVLALTGEQHLIGDYRWVEVIAADGQQGWVFGGAIEMP